MDAIDPKHDDWASRPTGTVDAIALFRSPVVRVASRAAVRMEVGNSVVMTTGPVVITDILSGLFRGAALSDMKISLNLIRIDGPMPDEPLHYHLGNILILVTSGSGYLRYVEDEVEKEIEVSTQDIIAIPSGALHSFTCDEDRTAEYAVLELGPDIDYQAHHYRAQSSKQSLKGQ